MVAIQEGVPSGCEPVAILSSKKFSLGEITSEGVVEAGLGCLPKSLNFAKPASMYRRRAAQPFLLS
jgi:hypothetical protein